MNHYDERDHAEEAVNGNTCPGCGESPCPDGGDCDYCHVPEESGVSYGGMSEVIACGNDLPCTVHGG